MPGPAATVGSDHMCPMFNPGSPPPPHVGGPVSGPGIPTVLIGGKPASVMGDMCTCVGPPDTIVTGVANVLIGGKPAVTLGDMTAHGGSITLGDMTVLIGTSQAVATAVMPLHKIPKPKFSTSVGNKLLSSRSANAGAIAKQEEILASAPVEEVPEDSTTVTLTTTFSQEQLVHLCKSQPKAIFMALFINTFGTDIPTLAFEELYKDIQTNAAILKAPLKVKKEIPFGGRKATFYSNKEDGVHEIFIAEQVIRDAAEEENNELRGELMTMMVEEYGHYLDYLLRHHYANTVKKDAMHDEGAKFAYKLYSINPIENADQKFAEATIDDAQPIPMIWDFTEFHNDLKQYVNKERQQQDDNLGNYEFYKAGFLKPGHGEYGHGDIEKEALTPVLIDLADDKVIKSNKIQQILDKIYLGNWLRDFSQMADPMIVRPMSIAMEVAAEASHGDITKAKVLTTPQKSNEGYKNNDIIEGESVTMNYPTGINIPRENWYDLPSLSNIQITNSSKDFEPVKVSLDFVATAIELLAAKEFVRDNNSNPKKKHKKTDDFTGYLAAFRKEFGQIDIDRLGVYRPEEHIDNPKGLGQVKVNNKLYDRGDHQLYSKFVGMVSDDSKLHDINTSYGMKNYIRSEDNNHNTGGGVNLDSAYGYIKKQLKKAADGNFDDTTSLAHLGAALHTLEDYFAHTNYAELCLIKSVEKAVFPWVDKVTPEGTNSKTFDYKYTEIQSGSKYYEDYMLFSKSALKSATGKNNYLAACIPIVTGTFGSVDTLASVLPLANEHLFSIEIEPWEKAKCNSYTFADIMMLELAKDFDANLDQSNDTINLENSVNLLFGVRNVISCGQKKWLIPDKLKEGLHYISEFLKIKQHFMRYFVASAGIAAINDAQVATNKDLKIMAAGKFAIGTDPSHTQIAKDDTEHPLHELSSKLAIHAVKHIGEAIFDAWKNEKKSSDKAIELLDICIKHPSVSDWQDRIVVDWAEKNPDKVCAACSPSVIIERVFHTIEHLEEGIKEVKDFVNNDTTIEELAKFFKEQTGGEFDIDALKNDVSKSLKSCELLLANTNTARKKWDTLYPKPDYCIRLENKETKTYIIQKGDTLHGLADKYGTTAHVLKSLNPQIIDNKIYAGRPLKVPVEKKNQNGNHEHK